MLTLILTQFVKYCNVSHMRRLTKRRMAVAAAVRMTTAERERWFAASRLLGVSQSEFLRAALRERVERTLAAAVGAQS